MIGFYDYTVILTYASLLSAGTGIVVSLSGKGHPYIGIFLLLFCGLCDAFDGKVAHTKKNRTELERKFGIQIDSLSDLIAFGVLPCCIGAAFIRYSPYLNNTLDINGCRWNNVAVRIIIFAILVLYILTALIRLAYFNVTEEERQQKEGGRRKYFLGLPVTSAAIIFPTVALIQYITLIDFTWLYLAAVVITGTLFITPIKVKKPGLWGILAMIGVGLAEFILFMIFRFAVYA